MGIYEDAFKGVLYDVGGYTVIQINDVGTIDDNGESIKVTPLAAACYGGQPNVVKLLLENGALPDKDVDKRTPFSFTISSSASSKTQSTVIAELIRAKANINLACDENGNTPLMAAIVYSPYDRIIRKLVAGGAAVDKATKELAKQFSRENLLDKESDTGAMSKQQIVDLVVGLVQVVVAYANDLTATKVLGGVVKQVYDMSGIKRSDIIKV